VDERHFSKSTDRGEDGEELIGGVTRPEMTTTTAATASAVTGRLRPRRSCLAVPGSNPRFLEKAQGLPAD
jgi:hypothetical protein